MPTANREVNAEVCCGQIDNTVQATDHAMMGKRAKSGVGGRFRLKPGPTSTSPVPKKKKTKPPLYFGQWLARLERNQVEVAKNAGIGKSYMSHLVSGEKDNPSVHVVYRISEELGITVNDLFRQPPPRSAAEATRKLRPAQIAALGRLLDEYEEDRAKR